MSDVEVNGVAKRFGSTTVLTGVDLTVPGGTLAAVLGPSGCGKTTLLRIIAGFETADAGTVRLNGRTVDDLPPERRKVGIVPQEGALFPHLSVAGNVSFGLSRRTGPSAARRQRVEELLDLIGLSGHRDRMPHELSGGQQQRVALARALAPDPAVVLLDEPFNALDSELRAAVRTDVLTALRTAGATAILVTHDQAEALAMSDLVAVLADGRVAQAAAPTELYTRPVDPRVAAFVGDAVLLPARRRGGTADCPLGRIPIHPIHSISPDGRPTRASDDDGERGLVLVRPEQVTLGPAAHGVPGRIRGTEFYGHDALTRVAIADDSGVEVEILARTLRSVPDALVDDGAVGVSVTGTAIFFPESA